MEGWKVPLGRGRRSVRLGQCDYHSSGCAAATECGAERRCTPYTRSVRLPPLAHWCWLAALLGEWADGGTVLRWTEKRGRCDMMSYVSLCIETSPWPFQTPTLLCTPLRNRQVRITNVNDSQLIN